MTGWVKAALDGEAISQTFTRQKRRQIHQAGRISVRTSPWSLAAAVANQQSRLFSVARTVIHCVPRGRGRLIAGCLSFDVRGDVQRGQQPDGACDKGCEGISKRPPSFRELRQCAERTTEKTAMLVCERTRKQGGGSARESSDEPIFALVYGR